MAEDKTMIPLTAHELDMARAERSNKRLWMLSIILIILLAASNSFWVWREAQFSDEIITVEQESETGYNNYIGNDGEIAN